MDRRVLFSSVIALALLLGGAASTAGVALAGEAPNSADAQTAERAVPLGRWWRTLARRYVNRKVIAKEVGKQAAEHALEEWLLNGKCSSLLPAQYFCPRTPLRWGLGYALTWGGRQPGVWTSPSSPRRLVRLTDGTVYALRVGTLYWLTCHVRGDLVTDGGIRTNLWYRLRSGGYVNDGWLQTGTNSVIPGVRSC